MSLSLIMGKEKKVRAWKGMKNQKTKRNHYNKSKENVHWIINSFPEKCKIKLHFYYGTLKIAKI